MKKTLLAFMLSGLAVVLPSCGGDSTPSTRTGGSGGGTGGAVSTAGAVGSGGTSETGGRVGPGGIEAVGGSSPAGGMPGAGGRSASGGSVAGGAPGTGGRSASGGSAAGGAPTTGGQTGAGGGTSTGGGPAAGGISSTGGSAPGGASGTPDAGPRGGRDGGNLAVGGSGSVDSGTGGTPSLDGGSGSPGCGKTITRPDSKTQQTMDIQGTTRYYLLDVPTSADNKTPLMLVFALHGHNMNNISVVGMYNFTSRSGGKTITVYPQGDGDAPGTTSKWGSGITSNWTSNDTNYTYIQSLKTDLESRFCIDTSREYFTGFSMGGMFTNSIACAHSSWFRGYAPVEGMGPGSCADKNAKPAIMIHQGTADTTVTPTAGGEPTRDFWIKQDGCNQTTTSAFTGCTSYSGCAEPVVYCVGNWNHTVDSIATANIWSFFNGLP